MQSIRARRIPSKSVDVQIDEFEGSLRITLEYNLLYGVNRRYWHEMDELDPKDIQSINNAIRVTMIDLRYTYKHSTEIMNLLNNAQVLIQNVMWASMNVPFPANPDFHIGRVINNTLEVYWREIYALLRTEMIMTNHAVGLVQRNWRRCISNPEHIACRRRLLHEFQSIDC